MNQTNKNVNELFRILKNTKGVIIAFLLSHDGNMHFWDEDKLNNDSVELQLFMESVRFLDKIDRNTVLNYKAGHWQFYDRVLSLYSVNGNKILLICKSDFFSESFQQMILEVLLTI